MTSIQRAALVEARWLGVAGHLAQLRARSLELVGRAAAAKERREATGQRARGDGAAVPREDALREAIPERAALEEEVGRGRGDGREHPRLFVARVEDRDELARDEHEALGGQRREGRGRALPEHTRLAEHPVEQRALELLDRPGEPPERARRVYPDERLGVKESGWSTWSV
jgi:hypothetical protein